MQKYLHLLINHQLCFISDEVAGLEAGLQPERLEVGPVIKKGVVGVKNPATKRTETEKGICHQCLISVVNLCQMYKKKYIKGFPLGWKSCLRTAALPTHLVALGLASWPES